MDRTYISSPGLGMYNAHRDGRRGRAGYRAGRIAAAPVKTEPKQIGKRRPRLMMTIETVRTRETCCVERLAATQKLADELASLRKLSCTMAEGHLVFIPPAYSSCAG